QMEDEILHETPSSEAIAPIAFRRGMSVAAFVPGSKGSNRRARGCWLHLRAQVESLRGNLPLICKNLPSPWGRHSCLSHYRGADIPVCHPSQADIPVCHPSQADKKVCHPSQADKKVCPTDLVPHARLFRGRHRLAVLVEVGHVHLRGGLQD